MWWNKKRKPGTVTGFKKKYKKLPWKFRRKYKYEITHDFETFIPNHIFGDIAVTMGRQVSFGANGFVKLRWMKTLRSYKLTIKRGYRWDGCSGPTIDTYTNMRGGCLHDALYQLFREWVIVYTSNGADEYWVNKVDQWLKEILLQDGMNKILAWAYYQGVNNWFAHRSARPNK